METELEQFQDQIAEWSDEESDKIFAKQGQVIQE